MPWQKGHPYIGVGAGRKGYEVEQKQLEKMNKVLNGVIELSEDLLAQKKKKFSKQKLAEIDFLIRKIETIKPLAMKFCDKMHANKNDLNAKVAVGFSLNDLYDQSNDN
jgi:hypothetical protein